MKHWATPDDAIMKSTGIALLSVLFPLYTIKGQEPWPITCTYTVPAPPEVVFQWTTTTSDSEIIKGRLMVDGATQAITSDVSRFAHRHPFVLSEIRHVPLASLILQRQTIRSGCDTRAIDVFTMKYGVADGPRQLWTTTPTAMHWDEYELRDGYMGKHWKSWQTIVFNGETGNVTYAQITHSDKYLQELRDSATSGVRCLDSFPGKK